MTNVIYMCPKCNSSMVEVSPLIGANSTCKGCGFESSASSFVAVPVDERTHAEATEFYKKELRRKFLLLFSASCAVPVARFLREIGLLKNGTKEEMTNQLAGYIKAMGEAMFVAMFKHMEEEERLKSEARVKGIDNKRKANLWN